MVFSDVARLDLDNTIFRDKTVLYRCNNPVEDLSYGRNLDSFTYYTIPAQGSIANLGNHLVKMGLLVNGDCRLILRYQYTEDAFGTTITPTLIPKVRDQISMGNVWFRLDAVTPLLGEDNGIIAFECVGKPASTPSDLLFPLTFPILLS